MYNGGDVEEGKGDGRGGEFTPRGTRQPILLAMGESGRPGLAVSRESSETGVRTGSGGGAVQWRGAPFAKWPGRPTREEKEINEEEDQEEAEDQEKGWLSPR